MNNLFVIYTLLFLLTATVGIELGYWLSRRKFVDVSEAYEDLRMANARSDVTHWMRLWKRLDRLDVPHETDLSGINEQMDRMEHQLVVMSQRLNSMPKADALDLSEVYGQLNKITDQLDRLSQRAAKGKGAIRDVKSLGDTDRLPAIKNASIGEGL